MPLAPMTAAGRQILILGKALPPLLSRVRVERKKETPTFQSDEVWTALRCLVIHVQGLFGEGDTRGMGMNVVSPRSAHYD